MGYKDPDIAREYLARYKKRLTKERRPIVIKLLGGKCAKCGSDKNLEFDHVNPKNKKWEISQILDYKFSVLLEELAKCQLLCESCHILKTAKERHKPIRHGTNTGYKIGCRCQACTDYNKKDCHERYLKRKLKKS